MMVPVLHLLEHSIALALMTLGGSAAGRWLDDYFMLKRC